MLRVFISILMLSGMVFLSGCNSLEAKDESSKIAEAKQILEKKVKYPLGVIGEVEPVYISTFTAPFEARIDTGATTSSIDARNIKEFERDGKKWVSFELINRKTKEEKTIRKKIIGRTKITRQHKNEHRLIVKLRIKIGKESLVRKFTLADRSKFKYPVLIGRNVLSGLAVVDVNLKNTLD